MRRQPWLGAALIGLGVGVITYALLGPLVTGVIVFRTSEGALTQITGGDVAALVLTGPACLAIGVLALRGHRAAPVLALGPAVFGMYTYSQILLGNEWARYDGNVERFFPLLAGLFVLSGAVAVLAVRAVDTDTLPLPSRRLTRAVGWGLLVSAAFVVVGLHLGSYLDAVSGSPTLASYLGAPTAFWVVKLWDVGILAPVAVTVGVGLLRGADWARLPMYAVLGGYTLLVAAVTGMAVTMYVDGDPEASLGMIAATGTILVAFTALLLRLYRPFFGASTAAPGVPSQRAAEAAAQGRPSPRS
jgi:hypothetical protein